MPTAQLLLGVLPPTSAARVFLLSELLLLQLTSISSPLQMAPWRRVFKNSPTIPTMFAC